MNERIKSIVDRMAQLESELHAELKKTVGTVTDVMKDKTLDIERSSTLRHIVSVPFIYSMIVPLAFLDLTLSLYQAICFRLYGISRVSRSKHFVIDRQHLDKINMLDKFNCVYCGYGNGVVTFAREIISKTEQYWCPIKHAQKTLTTAKRYEEFLEYGDTDDYEIKKAAYRDKLRSEG